MSAELVQVSPEMLASAQKHFQRSVKLRAIDLLQKLPDTCTWDEVLDQLETCEKIDEGMRAVLEGRVVSHADVMREFLHKDG